MTTSDTPSDSPPESYAPNASPDSLPLTDEAAAQLVAEAAQDTGFATDLERIITKNMTDNGAASVETIGQLGAKFTEYLGNEDAAWFLLNFLSQPQEFRGDAIEAVDALNPEAAAQLWATARSLRAIHGTYLELAARMWGELPDDWMHAGVEVDFSLGAEMWFVTLNLTKYDNTEISIRGTPSSMLNLVHVVLSTLSDLPAADVEYDPDSLTAGLAAMRAFREIYEEITPPESAGL